MSIIKVVAFNMEHRRVEGQGIIEIKSLGLKYGFPIHIAHERCHYGAFARIQGTQNP